MNSRFSLHIKYLAVVILVVIGQALHAQHHSLTVIGHPEGPPTALKQSELKSILLGERQRWRNDKKIVIAMMKTTTDAGKAICDRIYNMTPDELKKYWLSLVFQGKAEAPTFFNSAEELQNFVAETPGAIGVLHDASTPNGTVLIMIDGKRSL